MSGTLPFSFSIAVVASSTEPILTRAVETSLVPGGGGMILQFFTEPKSPKSARRTGSVMSQGSPRT